MSTLQHPTLLTDLTDCEEAVWRALVSGDAAADAALLCPDFLGVYPDGFADRDTHTGQLEKGPSIAAFKLSDHRARQLGANHALLSYRASFRRVGKTADEVMFVSSIWERHPMGWINVFSQDTPAAAE